MKTQKISLANIKDVLSRDEMKSIMAGSGDATSCRGRCASGGECYHPFDDRIYQCWCTSEGQVNPWSCS